jgi:hypothetical protein
MKCEGRVSTNEVVWNELRCHGERVIAVERRIRKLVKAAARFVEQPLLLHLLPRVTV